MPNDTSISSKIPKDYPTSPDIEDRRNEDHSDAPKGLPAGFAPLPEVVIQSKPGYDIAHKARKKIQ